jgi:PHD/YefM family antitoxin component YafN of YafNO toxin-antitoxin module
MRDMLRVSAAEFQRNLGKYSDLALSRPVTVTRNGRDRTVMISTEEYHRLKRRDREVLAAEDFTDEDLALIAKSEPPAETAQFDHELDSDI